MVVFNKISYQIVCYYYTINRMGPRQKFALPIKYYKKYYILTNAFYVFLFKFLTVV